MKAPYTVLSALLATAAGAQTINQSNFTFNPNLLTVPPGTEITITLGGGHTFTQVSEATWNANGNTALPGGFNFNSGTHQLTLTDPGTYYYVCIPHASMGMKGRIVVESGTGVREPLTERIALVFPNPVAQELTVQQPEAAGGTALLIDAQGRQALQSPLTGNDRLPVAGLAPGTYVLRITDRDGTLRREQRVVIAR
ncbi:MAG: plastocyanin/azurin family copper-binding protein [Flavobacteriales bacterium]|nr:MAG: plastocyanin/azurin family copper-binding protein [Flavobacteriales bacterium]